MAKYFFEISFFFYIIYFIGYIQGQIVQWEDIVKKFQGYKKSGIYISMNI